MTTNEALKLIRKDIKRARKLEDDRSKIESEIFNLLDQLHVNIDADTAAENADKLEDAITCYITYDEFSVDSIMEEIEKQLHRIVR